MDSQNLPACYSKPEFYVIIWGVIDTVLILSILMGNILTICAIRVNRKLSQVISNRFIVSLAISDTMVALTVPYHYILLIGNDLKNNKTLCLISYTFLVFSCTSSVFNLLAIATDRYIAIIYPLHYTRRMTRRVAALFICTIWIISMAFAIIPIYWNLWTEMSICVIDQVLPREYVNCIIIPMFLLIWFDMLLIYYRIWRRAIDHTKRIRSFQRKLSNQTDRKSISMVLLIMGCFSICWLPLLISLTIRTEDCDLIHAPLWRKIAYRLSMMNSLMNPIIYAWKNVNFRSTFRCLLRLNVPEVQNGIFITNYDPTRRTIETNASISQKDEYI